MTILPADSLANARALLEARGLRRPSETLPFLVQQLLRWRTALKGSPDFTASGLHPLLRSFRELGFDTLPGTPSRWNQQQRSALEALFLDLASRVAIGPALELPDLAGKTKPSERLRLPEWIWNHVDHHGAALTLGLLESGILASDPKDPRFEQQSELRARIVQLAGAVVPFATYLAGPSGVEMTQDQALRTASALLDEFSICLDEAFRSAGPQGAWLARSGGWFRPRYPFNAQALVNLEARS